MVRPLVVAAVAVLLAQDAGTALGAAESQARAQIDGGSVAGVDQVCERCGRDHRLIIG